jgi:predicted dehydrogenase
LSATLAERPIGVGIIGMGFMGSTHAAAYADAAHDGYSCKIVAVADGNPQRMTGAPWTRGNLPASKEEQTLFDPKGVRTYTDPAALLADPAVDLVSICTHTDTHVALALAALQSGKHVLLEKPVALTAALQRLLSDSSLRTTFGARSRKHAVETFDERQIIQQYLAPYEAAWSHQDSTVS